MTFLAQLMVLMMAFSCEPENPEVLPGTGDNQNPGQGETPDPTPDQESAQAY